MLDRVTHAGLRRQVDDDARPSRFEEREDSRLVGQFHARAGHAARRQEVSDPLFLQRRIVVGVEVVAAHHVVPEFGESSRDMTADESGCAGHEDLPSLIHPPYRCLAANLARSTDARSVLRNADESSWDAPV
jgi:hypothetical protein